MKLLILLALLLPLAAGAQVRKCTIDGQITYSDSLCGQDGQAVTATVNSMDTSGMLRQAAKKDAESAQARTGIAAKAARKRDSQSQPCSTKFAGPIPTERERDQHRACLRSLSK